MYVLIFVMCTNKRVGEMLNIISLDQYRNTLTQICKILNKTTQSGFCNNCN